MGNCSTIAPKQVLFHDSDDANEMKGGCNFEGREDLCAFVNV